MIVATRAATGLKALIAATLIFLALLSAASASEEQPVYTLQAYGLACPFCAYGIEKQLSRIEGVESVSTDIKSGTVTITMQAGAALEEATAKRAVDKAGFTMRDFKQKENSE